MSDPKGHLDTICNRFTACRCAFVVLYALLRVIFHSLVSNPDLKMGKRMKPMGTQSLTGLG